MSWNNLSRLLVGIGALLVLLSVIGHVPLMQTSQRWDAKTRWLVSLSGIALVVVGVGIFGHYNDWWGDLSITRPAK